MGHYLPLSGGISSAQAARRRSALGLGGSVGGPEPVALGGSESLRARAKAVAPALGEGESLGERRKRALGDGGGPGVRARDGGSGR